MAVTLPNMGLVKWNLSSDGFNHTELAANFDALDTHDHSASKGVQVSTNGIANSAISNAKLQSNAVQTANILDGNVTDGKLNSPNNTVPRNVVTAAFRLSGATTSVVRISAVDGSLLATGSDLGAGIAPATMVILNAADYAVNGKNTRFSIRSILTVNATAPAASFTIGLYPLTSTGGGGSVHRYNVGAVTGNTVTFTTPAAGGSPNTAVTADFAPPTDGVYVFGVLPSTTTASTTSITGSIQLRVHNT